MEELNFHPVWFIFRLMRPTNQNNRKKIIYLAGLVVICLLIVGWTRIKLNQRPQDQAAKLKEVLMLPPGDVIRQIDLGYHTLAASLLFIRANIYYGHQMANYLETHWLQDFVRILIELDPDFRKIYMWGAMATTYYSRTIDHVPPARIMLANQILALGLERFPDDYKFPMRIGFNFHYEIGDADRAIPFFAQAANKANAPKWLKEKLVDLYSQKGRKEIAKNILAELIGESEDPNVTATLRQRMKYILNEDERKKITNLQKRLLHEWKTNFEFIPFDLYLLIREKRLTVED
jgi:hypothetical protein